MISDIHNLNSKSQIQDKDQDSKEENRFVILPFEIVEYKFLIITSKPENYLSFKLINKIRDKLLKK